MLGGAHIGYSIGGSITERNGSLRHGLDLALMPVLISLRQSPMMSYSLRVANFAYFRPSSKDLPTVSAGRQLASCAIDWAVLASSPLLAAAALFNLHEQGGWENVVLLFIISLVWTLVLTLGQLAQLRARQSTIGQRLLGIGIIDIVEGRPAGLKRTALLRPLVWVIPVVSFLVIAVAIEAAEIDLENSTMQLIMGLVGLVGLAFSYGLVFLPAHRMLGDRIAGTRVVRW